MELIARSPHYFKAEVMHARHFPRKHRFLYKAGYWLFDFDQRAQLNSITLSKLNSFHYYSFCEDDYGFGDEGCAVWLKKIRQEYNLSSNWRVLLLTQPRILGRAFNPVSFWMFLDSENRLRAVISEVHNTFAERHAYLSHLPQFAEITNQTWLESEKSFHVSPFFEVKGQYKFLFKLTNDTLDVRIRYFDGQQELLSTALYGKLIDLTQQSWIDRIFMQPFYVLRVITLIHYQALKIWLKKIRYIPKPKPPIRDITPPTS